MVKCNVLIMFEMDDNPESAELVVCYQAKDEHIDAGPHNVSATNTYLGEKAVKAYGELAKTVDSVVNGKYKYDR